MADLLREYWIFLVIALLVGLVVAWWLLAGQRRTRVELGETDAGNGPARRNQALIDAPPAAVPTTPAPPPPTPEALAGIGEAVAVSADLAASPPPPSPPVASPPPPAPGAADDLRRIKGVGPKLVELLHSLGITRFSQIAAWDDAEIDRIDAQLGRFAGRIRRDSWPDQARLLAADDTAGYEAKFGKL